MLKGGNMTRHKPTNLKLPALEIEKKSDRKAIENDSKVQNLIKSNLLLDRELITLLSKIKDLTDEINKILKDLEKNSQDFKESKGEETPELYSFIYEGSLEGLGMELGKLYYKLATAKTEKEKKGYLKRLEEIYMDGFKRYNSKLKRKLTRKSNQTQKLLDELERKKGINLDILVSTPIYFCQNCKSLIGTERFHSTICVCGTKINNVNKAEDKTVHLFNEPVFSFVDNDLWLEHGIDYLFRKKDYQTLCGYYVLGHSSMSHEIDNIVENYKDDIRIFCECKNTSITVNDVFNFSGKMLDVGCSRGYIFTTFSEIQKEIRHLARSKNISIIDSVLKKSEEQIMNEIKE